MAFRNPDVDYEMAAMLEGWNPLRSTTMVEFLKDMEELYGGWSQARCYKGDRLLFHRFIEVKRKRLLAVGFTNLIPDIVSMPEPPAQSEALGLLQQINPKHPDVVYYELCVKEYASQRRAGN